jgi:thioester reductase-like protein
MGQALHLVTGFPGLLGTRLVERLAALPGERLVLLVQPPHAAQARQALGDRPGAEVLEGDVAHIHLGLSGAEWRGLTRHLTHAWHLAAKTRLGSDDRLLQSVNLEGTRTVLELCAQAPRLSRLVHFSTAFVSGTRRGVVGEDELEAGQAFHNAYEESKFQAERLVHLARATVPATVLRPSLVIGDSRTGEIDRFEGPYALALALARAPVAMPLPLPEDPQAPLNVVPIDFVLDAAMVIGRHPAAGGRTVHLVDPAPLPARQVYELIARRLGRRLATVPIPQRALEALRRLPLVDRFGGRAGQALHYVDHLASYDTHHLLELLEGSGVRCPPITDYLDRIIEFVQADFARRRQAATTDLPAAGDQPPPVKRR